MSNGLHQVSLDGKEGIHCSASITYRSSTQIGGVEATARCAKDKHMVTVNFPNDEEEIVIKFSEVVNLKAKDYLEDDNYCWVLAIVLQDGMQHSLQFRLREDRDRWTKDLRTATSASSANAKDAEEDKGVQYRRITEVCLKEPGAEVLASASVSFMKGDEVSSAMIFVPEAKSSAENIKHITQDFISSHEVDPREGTSLYRFLRTVVQRSLLEKETCAIVEEIQRHNLDNMLKEAEESGKEQPNIPEMKARAEKSLHKLSSDIVQRLGEHGTGTSILSMMLRNNIEKMHHINELTVRARQHEEVGEDL